MRTYKILSLSVVILLIAVVFVGVVPAAAQYDTMQYRYNAQHSGDYSPVAGPVPSNGQLKWSYTTGSYVSASPAVANGVVYVGSDDGNVYALNATTGAKLWSFTTGYWVYSSPAVVNSVVYVGSTDHNIYAIDNAPAATSHGTSYAAAATSQGTTPGFDVVLVFAGLVFAGLVIAAYAVKTYRY